jgi:hypothetical protein
MDTTYCPVCGTENPNHAPHCASCGVNLQETNPERAPVHRQAIAIMLAPVALLLLAGQFLDFFAWSAFRLRAGLDGMLFSDDGLGKLWWLGLFSLASGCCAALLTGRDLGREARLAALGAWLVLLGAWGYSAEFGGLFTGTITMFRLGFSFSIPSLFALLLSAGMLFGGLQSGASLGGALRERVKNEARCPYCDATRAARPVALVCPHCKSALARGKIRWGWVWTGAALSVGLYAATLQFAGAPLNFYYRCELNDQGDECLRARVEYRKAAQAEGENPWGRIQDRKLGSDEPGYFVLFHTWRYALYLAPCFFVLPFLLGMRLRRGALATAGVVGPLSSAGAILCALFAFDFGAFEGALLYSLRYHVLDALIWSLAGSLGAVMGSRFGASPVQQLDEER